MKNTSPSKMNPSKHDKIQLSIILSGLAKTHRLIRVERNKEIQFMKLCAQIRLDDFKKLRSDRQRDDRREKRFKRVTIDWLQWPYLQFQNTFSWLTLLLYKKVERDQLSKLGLKYHFLTCISRRNKLAIHLTLKRLLLVTRSVVVSFLSQYLQHLL